MKNKEIYANGGEIRSELIEAKSKLEQVQNKQLLMRDTNAALRAKTGVDERLKALGYSDESIITIKEPDRYGRVGFASYSLTNNNANLKRLEARVKMLEKKMEGFEEAEMGNEQKYQFEGGEIEVNYAIDRVQIIFDGGRTDKETYSMLRKNGYVYSPSNKAFQRKITPQAIRNAVQLMKATKIEAKIEGTILLEDNTNNENDNFKNEVIDWLKENNVDTDELKFRHSDKSVYEKNRYKNPDEEIWIHRKNKSENEIGTVLTRESFDEYKNIGKEGADMFIYGSDLPVINIGSKDNSQELDDIFNSPEFSINENLYPDTIEYKNHLISKNDCCFVVRQKYTNFIAYESNDTATIDDVKSYIDRIAHIRQIGQIIPEPKFKVDTPEAEYNFLLYLFIGIKPDSKEQQLIDELKKLGVTNLYVSLKFDNEIDFEFNGHKFNVFDNAGEFKMDDKTTDNYNGVIYLSENDILKTPIELAKEIIELAKESSNFVELETNLFKEFDKIGENGILPIEIESETNLSPSSYKNPYELNRAIEKIIDEKGDKREDYSSEELNLIGYYSGYGGLEKFGATGDGLLYEYYTPDEICRKMWALAYKYGYGTVGDNSVLETSVGTGNFLKYAPEGVIIDAYEVNRYSQQICKILYPHAEVILQEFEKNFIKSNLSIKNKIQDLPKYSLVVSNPPYGKLYGKYIGMGEGKYTGASNFTEYFIFRGLDMLVSDGLLIYIVGAEQKNGGTLFLDGAMSNVKKSIFKKAELIDAYRLPTNIFERTGVSSEIVVFKKR